MDALHLADHEVERLSTQEGSTKASERKHFKYAQEDHERHTPLLLKMSCSTCSASRSRLVGTFGTLQIPE